MLKECSRLEYYEVPEQWFFKEFGNICLLDVGILAHCGCHQCTSMSKHSKTNHLPEYPYALGHRHFFSKRKFMQTKPPQNPVQTVVKTLGDDSLVYIQYIITVLSQVSPWGWQV